MGSVLSCAVGSTAAAVLVYSQRGLNVSSAVYCTGSLLSLLYWRTRKTSWPVTKNEAVFITGCDSGLGYSLALHSHRLGLTVFAACLNPEGPGARLLREKCGTERFFIIELDVTKDPSILQAHNKVVKTLSSHPHLQLRAIVNNAGIMVFGEFEWQTHDLITNQIQVNVLGTLKTTKAFLHLLRFYKGRIITISSHCALQALPGLAVYAGTKTALKAWSDGLRVELAKYGVSVVTIIPGSFAQQSNILAHQRTYMEEMLAEMTPEGREFYGDYFTRYNNYLCGLPMHWDKQELNDKHLYSMFECALLSPKPAPHYEHGPLRYQIYHFMFKHSPVWLRDKLVLKFMQMPKWVPK